MKRLLHLLIFALLLNSCQQSSRNHPELATMEEEVVPTTRQAQTPVPPSAEEVTDTKINKKKIIKDGRMGIRVKDLEQTKARVDSVLKENEGYYANEQFNNTDRLSSYQLQIRIPSRNFEAFLLQLESGAGEVLYKEIKARDVTDQFIDLETRLENKRNYLKRYNELLKRAKNVKEILEIEEKIRVLEEEVESTTGRLNYLKDQVAYSSLALNISKKKDFKYAPKQRDRFTERLKQSLSKGWFGLVDFLLFMIRIWPFWIILSVIIYFWRRYLKRWKQKHRNPKV